MCIRDSGSTIRNTKSGIIILTSSDVDIPVIYLTSTIGPYLGMATDEVFAGNEYFYKPNSHLIKYSNTNEGAVVRFKEVINYDGEQKPSSNKPGLNVDNGSGAIIKALQLYKLDGSKVNNSSEVVRSFEGLKKISAARFHTLHIAKFLRTFKKHYDTKTETT